MSHEIDLHGIPHDRAILDTEDFLLRLSINLGFEATIITGNSYRLQKKIIEEILDVYKFSYYIPSSNLGIIKVRDERVYGKISIN
jgi:hypothetical protein